MVSYLSIFSHTRYSAIYCLIERISTGSKNDIDIEDIEIRINLSQWR